ncbi:MAG: hypothetical protein AB7I38_17755, partial [Dehalococcoidia bacterium]
MYSGSVGLGVIAVFALAIGGWLYAHRDAPRATTALFVIAGMGISGLIGQVFASGLRRVLGLAGGAGSALVGATALAVISAIALIAFLEVIVKGVGIPRRRNASPRRWHPWLGLAHPTNVIVSGVPVLAASFSGIVELAGQAGTAITH